MKLKITLIVIILSSAFIGLIYKGLMHSRGVPVKVERFTPPVINVPFLKEKNFDLTKKNSWKIWNDIPSQKIKLIYQVTVLPWAKNLIPYVTVKAFHNKEEIYFYMSWEDNTESRNIGINKFSDACAIMFPIGEEIDPASIMMGFNGHANIWQWKASQDKEYWHLQKFNSEPKVYVDFYYPYEEKELFPVSKAISKSAVNDITAIRVGTVTLKDMQKVEGRGFWDKGIWGVVFKRSLKQNQAEGELEFVPGKKRLCAFALWNGAKGDRGGRKSISNWVELEVK